MPHTTRLLALLALLLAGGCARWGADKFDVSRFRDPRASDIDKRLSAPMPERTGPSPFEAM